MANNGQEKNSTNSNNANPNTPPAAPPPPTSREVAQAIAKLVGDLEAFPPEAQRRVLEGAATAMGIHRQPAQQQRTQQRTNGGNNRS